MFERRFVSTRWVGGTKNSGKLLGGVNVGRVFVWKRNPSVN